MMTVVVAVAVDVAERFVGMWVGVAVERQQGDGPHEERAGKKLHGLHGLMEHRP